MDEPEIFSAGGGGEMRLFPSPLSPGVGWQGWCRSGLRTPPPHPACMHACMRASRRSVSPLDALIRRRNGAKLGLTADSGKRKKKEGEEEAEAVKCCPQSCAAVLLLLEVTALPVLRLVHRTTNVLHRGTPTEAAVWDTANVSEQAYWLHFHSYLVILFLGLHDKLS